MVVFPTYTTPYRTNKNNSNNTNCQNSGITSFKMDKIYHIYILILTKIKYRQEDKGHIVIPVT